MGRAAILHRRLNVSFNDRIEYCHFAGTDTVMIDMLNIFLTHDDNTFWIMAFDLFVEKSYVASCDQGIDRQMKLFCDFESVDADRTGGTQ